MDDTRSAADPTAPPAPRDSAAEPDLLRPPPPSDAELADAAEQAFVRGIEAHRAGRLAEAQRLYDAALQVAPDHLQVLNNLGVLLRQRRRQAAAEACLRRVLALDAANAGALANLGNLLRDSFRMEEARDCFRRAVEAEPEDGSLWHGLGRCQRDLGETAAAVASLGRALELTQAEGRKPPIVWDLAVALLRRGDYANGLQAYEARWKLPELQRRHVAVPAWDAGPLEGRRVLVWAEQGLAETLQFLRYVPLLAARGGRVVLEVQPDLLPLVQGLEGVDEVLPRGAPVPDVDLQVPLASLPYLFGTSAAGVPAETPYLPLPQRRFDLPPALGTPRRVGLVWSSREGRRPADGLEPALESLLPLAGVPGLRLYSLQKGPAAAELVETAAGGLLVDLSDRLESWQATAACLMELDLLISVDCATAHLAGALGRPAWVLLRHAPDWRWGERAETTPWYPSLRLFRQPAAGDWAGAVAAAVAALQGWTAS